MKFELRAIRAKDCGPLGDVRIEFYDEQLRTLPVCVVAGANGSGKTTVLDIISWLASGIERYPLSARLNSDQSYAQIDCLLDGKPFSLAYGKKPEDAILPDDYCYFEKPNQANQHGVVIKALQTSIVEYRDHAIEFQHIASASSNGNTPPSILYFPHTRGLAPVAGENLLKEEIPYHFVQRVEIPESFKGSLNSYLIWLDYAEPEKFSVMRDLLNQLNFDGKTFHARRKTLDIMVHTRDNHEHKLHELSSGEQNILIILMNLRRRLLPHSVVLIDEIENSLHPAFQHKLAEGLLTLQKMTPFQLIVTTHSWAFAEIFGAQAIRMLTKF